MVFFGGSDLILSMTLTGLVIDKARAGEQTRFYGPMGRSLIKRRMPIQEALLYIKAVLLHGGRRKTRQILAIVAHWRQFGSTQNRLLKLLLKKSSAAASGVRPCGKAAANTPG